MKIGPGDSRAFVANCPSCSGAGAIVCCRCHGSGESFTGACERCGGAGGWACGKCDGDGEALTHNLLPALVCKECGDWVSRLEDYKVVQAFVDHHARCSA